MVYDRERMRREDAVYAEHKKAVAAGEKRVLRTTSTGEVHSYPADEIGFTPGRGQVQVSTWWGMGVITIVLGLALIVGIWLFQRPLWEGGLPDWGALWLIGFAGLMTLYTFNLAATSTGPPSSASCVAPRSPALPAASTSIFRSGNPSLCSSRSVPALERVPESPVWLRVTSRGLPSADHHLAIELFTNRR